MLVIKPSHQREESWMDETCRDTVTTVLMTHASVISPVNVHSSCTICNCVHLCVCMCLHLSCMTSSAHWWNSQTFFFYLSKILSAVTSIPLLPPTHTNTYTHIHTRQLRHRLWNSLLPWQWNRARSLASPVLFYCFISPSLSVEANQLLLFDSFSPVGFRFCLFVCLFIQRHIIIVI